MKTGAGTQGIELSDRARRRLAEKRAREQAEWKSKCGPVTVRRVDPASLRRER